MKKSLFPNTVLKTLLLVTLVLFFASCQKEINSENTLGASQIENQSLSDKAKPIRHTKQFSSEVADQWFNLLSDVVKTKPYFSPQILRIYAYSGVALYESVVPGMPSYQSIYKHLTGNTIPLDKNKEYYWPACANAAIARISSRIMENYPTPNLTQVQALEASINASFPIELTTEQLQNSIAFGKQVADVIFEWSKEDGTLNPNGTIALCPPYTPLAQPGKWAPTPPGFFPAAGACQGNLRTFIPGIINTVLAPPPPSYSTDPSSDFYKAGNEVFNSTNNITTEQASLFNSWRDITANYHPLSHMLRITIDIVGKENMNLEDAATIYAKQTMAAYDAIVAVSHSKFYYALIRPVTYVRGVMGQTSWNSLPLTPQTPSYPDESSATASSIAILEEYLGNSYAFIDSTQNAQYGSRTYSSLDGLIKDVIQARVSGGTNFRFSGVAGANQGRAVGDLINALPFKKP